MDRIGGASVIAFVVLVSFAIDRLVTGILFLLSLSPRWREFCPEPGTVDESRTADAARRQKVAYFVLAGAFSVGVLFAANTGILSELGLASKGSFWDTFLTAIALMGGAERVSEFSKALSGGTSPAGMLAEPPMKITGTLILEEGTTIHRRSHETAKSS